MKLDFSKLQAQFQHLQQGLEETVSQGLSDIAKQGATIARSHIKSKASDGLSANTQPYKNRALNQGILANKYYATWVEEGNGPSGSRIYPVSAKALHFFIGGKEIFCKSVAASQPKPFMAPAREFIQQHGERIMASRVNKFLEGL